MTRGQGGRDWTGGRVESAGTSGAKPEESGGRDRTDKYLWGAGVAGPEAKGAGIEPAGTSGAEPEESGGRDRTDKYIWGADVV